MTEIPNAEQLTLDTQPRLAAQAWGPETGLRVLAINGWLDNSATFAPLAAYLPELRLVALDMPGHGHSGHRGPESSYHFVEWIADVFQAADALGWSSFHLLGHSMGAGIASLAAGTFPDRIERCALIEGIGAQTAEASEMPERLERYILERQKLKSKRPASYSSTEEALQSRMRAGDFANAEGIRLVVERGLKEKDGIWRWRADPRLRLHSGARLTLAQVQAFLARIECPSLVIRADAGLPIDPKYLAKLTSVMRALQLVSVQGGHHVHLDAPAVVAPALRRFFGLK